MSICSFIDEKKTKSSLHFLKIVAHNIYKYSEKPVCYLARQLRNFASTLLTVFSNAFKALDTLMESCINVIIRPLGLSHAADEHTPSVPKAFLLYTTLLLIEVGNVINTAVSLISLTLQPCFSSVHKPLRSYFSLPRINPPGMRALPSCAQKCRKYLKSLGFIFGNNSETPPTHSKAL